MADPKRINKKTDYHHQWRNWHTEDGPWSNKDWSPEWHRKKRFLMFRFIGFLSTMVFLFVGGMAILAFLFTRFFGGTGETAMLAWVVGSLGSKKLLGNVIGLPKSVNVEPASIE